MQTYRQWCAEVDRIVGETFPGKHAKDLAIFDGRAMWRNGWPARAWGDQLVAAELLRLSKS